MNSLILRYRYQYSFKTLDEQRNKSKEICLSDDRRLRKTEQHQRVNRINDEAVELLENLPLIQ